MFAVCCGNDVLSESKELKAETIATHAGRMSDAHFGAL